MLLFDLTLLSEIPRFWHARRHSTCFLFSYGLWLHLSLFCLPVCLSLFYVCLSLAVSFSLRPSLSLCLSFSLFISPSFLCLFYLSSLFARAPFLCALSSLSPVLAQWHTMDQWLTIFLLHTLIPVLLFAMRSQAITTTYQEPADNYSVELRSLMQLRGAAAVHVTRDAAGRDRLRQYFTQLEKLEPRFLAPLAVNISWSNTFTGSTDLGNTIAFERANVLYNYGALQAELGRTQWMASKGSEDTCLKGALTAFRAAAGAFTKLAELSQTGKGDMAPAALAVLPPLMLAQAQECFFAKALTDGRKASLLARMAMQVAEYYDRAHNALLVMQLHTIKAHPWAEWPLWVRVKALVYRALAQFFQAQACLEANTFGEQVARLRAAQSHGCAAAQAVASKPKDAWSRLLCQQLQSMVEDKLVKAEKDNAIIYLEKVVAEGLLAEIKPVSVVEPDLMVTDPTAKDLFTRLIPLSVHLVASEYSEQKAQVLRDINCAVETKNIELEKNLLAMELHRGMPTEQALELPPDIFQKAALLRDSSRGMGFADSRLAAIQQTGAQLQQKLGEVKAEVVASTLDQATREALLAEVNQLEQSLMDAYGIDNALRERWLDHQPRLALLSGPHEQLRRAMPSKNLLDGPLEDTAARARLEDLLKKVDLMKSIRKTEVEALRKQVGVRPE